VARDDGPERERAERQPEIQRGAVAAHDEAPTGRRRRGGQRDADRDAGRPADDAEHRDQGQQRAAVGDVRQQRRRHRSCEHPADGIWRGPVRAIHQPSGRDACGRVRDAQHQEDQADGRG